MIRLCENDASSEVSKGINVLLTAGADPNLTKGLNPTALLVALEKKNWQAAALILRWEAKSPSAGAPTQAAVCCVARSLKKKSSPWTVVAAHCATLKQAPFLEVVALLVEASRPSDLLVESKDGGELRSALAVLQEALQLRKGLAADVPGLENLVEQAIEAKVVAEEVAAKEAELAAEQQAAEEVAAKEAEAAAKEAEKEAAKVAEAEKSKNKAEKARLEEQHSKNRQILIAVGIALWAWFQFA